MPRTKGSKNKKSLTVDYAALIAEKQAEKDAAANEITAVAANIEELKAELKSKKTAAKKLNKELAKLVAKKAAVEAAAAEAAKRGEACLLYTSGGGDMGLVRCGDTERYRNIAHYAQYTGYSNLCIRCL